MNLTIFPLHTKHIFFSLEIDTSSSVTFFGLEYTSKKSTLFKSSEELPSFKSLIMRKIEYKNGQRIGKCIYLKDVAPYIPPFGREIRKALFQCECGNKFEAKIVSVKRGDTTSCGCYKRKLIRESNTIHGLSNHPFFTKWRAMIHRCSNPKDQAYKYYGARGITVCDEWLKNPKAYIDYIMGLENAGQPELSIDRINNDGNYEPGNIRWATAKQQANNRRSRKYL